MFANSVVLLSAYIAAGANAAAPAQKPNIVVIVADDLGYSDLGCYGSEVATPNLDGLAANGVRFNQFYNCARCCPTRSALLTGLYPHQAGVGHMLENWKPPSYTGGLGPNCVTIAQVLAEAGYRNYHVGKWHVGGVGAQAKKPMPNHPLDRGFHRAYGTGGGGNYFAPNPLYLDRQAVKPGPDYYITDALTEYAVRFLKDHETQHKDKPFFLHLCYTAPHFPLHAKPADIAKYRGKYREGWDVLRASRFERQKQMGLLSNQTKLSPRNPEAKAWSELSESERDEWDLRMAVYAAMIDCMDQGIGKVLEALRGQGVADNTLVVFFSDNGASAESLDSWPDVSRGHKPGSEVGTRDSHRCLEVGWANGANTPLREHKMWIEEGGISTPFIACWPALMKTKGGSTTAVGHVIDLAPTCYQAAGVDYPKQYAGRTLTPLAGESLIPKFQPTGIRWPPRTLAWEHEGNRGIRHGDIKLVAGFRGKWELYDLAADRSECQNLAADRPDEVKKLAAMWQEWADKVGVIPWEQLPGANYKPSPRYRKKSER